jgi:hypothetical protein
MNPRQQTDPELNSLIAEITVDCYDEDEALTGFENAFDEEPTFPIPATPIGQPIKILAIGTRNGRREPIATRQHAGQNHDVALLDTSIQPTHPANRPLNAYRH